MKCLHLVSADLRRRVARPFAPLSQEYYADFPGISRTLARRKGPSCGKLTGSQSTVGQN